MRNDLEIAQIGKQHDGQWVVVEITKTDKHNNPKCGRVLFHGHNQNEVYRQGPKYREAHPNVKLYYFYAGNVIPEAIGVVLVQGQSH